MTHVAKPEYTREIPAGAERCTVRRKPGVRWKGRGGKWVQGVVCRDNPARCRIEASCWYAYYTDAAGRPRSQKGYADRTATEALLAEIVRREARIATGVLPAEASAARVTLSDLLAEWGRHLRDAGRTPKHCADRPLMAGRLIAATGAVRPADLTPAKVVAAAAAVRDALGLSRRSTSHHVSAVKQFTRWLCRVRRSEPADHLAGLPCDAGADRPTFRRRALARDQFDRLLAATRVATVVRYGLTGPERAALYHCAARTGLRASELAALTPARLDLGDRPTVTVRSETAKNRRDDQLPLPAALAAELRQLVAGLAPSARIWPHRVERPNPGWSKWAAWWLNAADMIRRDFVAAGLELGTAEGVYDFHALRGQFATDLERSGVGLASAQRLMRHSTPALTSRHYTKRSAGELAGEVEKIDAKARGKKG